MAGASIDGCLCHGWLARQGTLSMRIKVESKPTAKKFGKNDATQCTGAQSLLLATLAVAELHWQFTFGGLQH